jgi:acyl carrier protein
MTPEEIKELVIHVITDIQTRSGRPVPDDIYDELHPVGEFDGFDSINAVEAASLLSEYLGYDVKSDLMLPTSLGRQLTLGEIVGRLQQSIGAEGGLLT